MGRTVSPHKIDGHSGDIWNNRADTLANLGRTTLCSTGRFGPPLRFQKCGIPDSNHRHLHILQDPFDEARPTKGALLSSPTQHNTSVGTATSIQSNPAPRMRRASHIRRISKAQLPNEQDPGDDTSCCCGCTRDASGSRHRCLTSGRRIHLVYECYPESAVEQHTDRPCNRCVALTGTRSSSNAGADSHSGHPPPLYAHTLPCITASPAITNPAETVNVPADGTNSPKGTPAPQ